MNQEQTFLDYMQKTLGYSPNELNQSGKIQRFDTNKKGNKHGWCVFFPDAPASGAFGDWSTDSQSTWCEKVEHDLTKAELRKQKQRIEAARKAQREEREKAQALAQVEAANIWRNASACPASHPYLENKDVKPLGIMQFNQYGSLCAVVPVRIDDKLTSLQFIQANGDKRFLKDGQIKGGFHLIGTPSKRIIVCEGYATACTIHEATGEAVATAFNAGNLSPVVKALRLKFPELSLVVAADNDHKKEAEGKGNAGLTKGKEAAELGNATLVHPPKHIEGSDFNDMAKEGGLDVVKKVFTVKADDRHIPWGYVCNKDGVSIHRDDKDAEQITYDPCWVSAISRDSKRGNWGRLVHWVDQDGYEHKQALPADMFHGQAEALAGFLASSGGLMIVPSKEKKLLQYLASFRTDKRLLSAPSTGWLSESFVLPLQTINEPTGEQVIFQPTESSAAMTCIMSKGSLKEWQEHVAGVAQSPLVQFAICAALAAPMRFHSGVDAGGFHFWGDTSQGKTTLLQAASSVWGNSSGSSEKGGGDAYLQRWNATKNGLEGMAAAFNDLPLCLDEIGEGDKKDVSGIIYNLMSGTGKTRMAKSINLRERKSWRILLLSTGEDSIPGYIKAGGQKVNGGTLARLVDITSDNIFKDEYEADAMKAACCDYYGTAGVNFLSLPEIVEDFKAAWKAFDADSIGEAASNIAGRVRKRFALVACTGELAIQSNILPWEKGAALAACQHAYALWLGSASASSEASRGVQSVKAFVLQNESRFEVAAVDVPHNRAGWKRNDLYHFTPAAFKEACNGSSDKGVMNELDELGFLVKARADRLGNRIRVAGKRVTVVSLKDDILSK
ncbi:MAG: DUF927 domain-containing protein [Mariprofundaceae bacterium]|nr:DUF927 domain-containing protein [Mariprofundaceae bacterium]